MKTHKPNVLFLFTDDQRFDMISAVGDPNVITPNMDALLESGTAFTKAHIPGGTCPAVCMPSRAMLHTGRTLFQLERSGEEIPENDVLLGEHFKKNGYFTFGCGKWHNGGAAFNRSFDDGDDIFLGGMCDHWNVPAYHFDPSGRYAKTLPQCADPFTSKKVLERACDHIRPGVHSSTLLADRAIKVINEYENDKPFFLYTSFLAPHDPRVMPRKYLDMYNLDAIDLPPNFMGGHPFDNGELHVRDETLAGFPRTPREIKEHIRDYRAMITHLDEEIGRVLTALDNKGIREETIIVLAGDNGLAVGQHGLMGKQNLYEHSVRVPLVFSGPGIPRKTRSDAGVYLFDVYPTLCELIGLEIPDSVEGVSVAPVFKGEPAGRKFLYLAYKDSQRGISDLNHKLVEYVVDGKRSETQLFNLENDPWELENLAKNPEHAGKLAELRSRLFALRDEWNDNQHGLGEVFWNAWKD
jgi:arylsulfatase A-like enzyme